MKVSRRNLLAAAGTGAVVGLTGTAESALAQMTAQPSGSRRAVHTLNGWSLPFKMRNGVKEFHLVAEEFEQEFAPASTAKVWG